MKTLQFKCTLLTDVILNVKSGTVGNNETLDFIPGNNFLGIAAKELYSSIQPEIALTLFHSDKVRFGDAHLGADDMRSLRIPASMSYPKLKKVSDVCYLFHYYYREKDHEGEGNTPQQLKQCRKGFYVFADGKGMPVQSDKSFAIKSAYDREKRRSKDETMYGYESLDKGAEMFFEIEIDQNCLSDEIIEDLKKALIGQKRIGRSRTAQYGLIKIEEQSFKESQSQTKMEDLVTVYADGRLIFLDDDGLPTFQPTPEQLEIKDSNAKICWEKSQIRTFQYTPWNFKRQAHDTDRCGIEKGSVFVVICTSSPDQSRYVGSYRNEGFGKVIYNPDFLKEADDAKNGEAKYVIEEKKDKDEVPEKALLGGTPLLDYIRGEKKKRETEESVYSMVNEFVDKNWKKYKSDAFASQWGNIRSIAMKYSNKEDLKRELFKNEKTINGKPVNLAYLAHGIAKVKWDDNKRLDTFKTFFDNLTDDKVQIALINLAAEMAKKCRKGARNG